MASSGIFELVALAAGAVQSDDVLAIVDVHDSTQAAQGSAKKITLANLYTSATTPVTVSTPLPNITQTWNAGGVTFTAVKLNVTDTASAAASLLIDLQVGAVSKFSVSKAGNVLVAGTMGVTGVVSFTEKLLMAGATATGASAGEIVLPNLLALRGVTAAGTASSKMIWLTNANRVALGTNDWSLPVLLPIDTAVNLPVSAANLAGASGVDSTNSRLIYYTAAGRFYLTGTAF